MDVCTFHFVHDDVQLFNPSLGFIRIPVHAISKEADNLHRSHMMPKKRRDHTMHVLAVCESPQKGPK